MHEAPDVKRWFIHYGHIPCVRHCATCEVWCFGSWLHFRLQVSYTYFICTLRQWLESKQGSFEQYVSTLKTRPKYKKYLITSTVAATRRIPKTSCISTHTMENVQSNTDIKTQICLYLSTFLTQGPANSAGQIAVSLRHYALLPNILHST